MKKLFLLGVAFIAVTAFAGCSKDDDAPEINPELIVGKWQLVREVGYESRDGVKYEEADDDLSATNTFVIFNANGAGYDYYETSKDTGHYGTDNFTYTLNSKTLKIKYDGKDSWGEQTIQKLTANELVLYLYHKSMENGSTYISEYTDYYIRK